ncbi:DNA repair protein RecN [Woodsholea maritima]|uniref:DNA repair protein RecN n=1 Tax=Woodsholea maritima TaxID=240237 RepID=UPI00035FE68B|nr:DNA repair protein RecN [Woodsholea maritima]
MLASLSIRDIVLIDTLDLTFEAGLCALTGETGAGKSILLGALGLACGERAERAQVRAGADKGTSTAIFELHLDHKAYAILAEAGVDVEPGEALVLRRTVTADGRSRAHVNDQAASVGLLRQLGDILVEIHGQHDGRGLMDPKTHIAQLDAFARNDAQRERVASAWKALSAARKTLNALEAAREKAAEEEEFLRQSVEDLSTLNPQDGEETELAATRKFLQRAEQALGDLQNAQNQLSGGDGLGARLNAALRGLERVRDLLSSDDEDQADPEGGADDTIAGRARASLDRATGAIDRALIEFDEAENALEEAAEAFDIEPGRLEQVEERLFALRAAARKHSVAVEDLQALRESLEERLNALDQSGDRLAKAEAAVKTAQVEYDQAAEALSQTRQKAGEALAKAVMAELKPLKLEKARFRVLHEAVREKASAKGWDQIAFEVATNPGAPFGPLDKIASGGELSRFALALKVCLAGDNPDMVMVFDEVDQGVGGAVADAVGARLARLAAQGQALVVTHAPQVAARAGHHWKIEKQVKAGQTRTIVYALNSEARREEVARMLSGAEITAAARAAADDLMAQ